MTKFEINKTYSARSICDSNCIWNFKVTKRTEKSIWIVGGSIKTPARKTINVYEDVESVKPFGRYSMSPTLRAK